MEESLTALKSILVVVLLAAAFIVVIAWIAKQGGWQSGGCNGNCSSCQARCESKQAGQGKEEDGPQG